jgi:hypothetical protein
VLTYQIGKVEAFAVNTRRRLSVPLRKSGGWFAAVSMILALVALAVAPVVFGPLGILMGMVAVYKGERYLGMLGLTASAVLAVTGYYIAGALIG